MDDDLADFFFAILCLADHIAGYSFFSLMIYLMEVWPITLAHAAAIVNIHEGFTGVLSIPITFLIDAYLDIRVMLLSSTITYAIGMVLLWVSIPPILTSSIGNTETILFYTAMGLITVGRSTWRTTLFRFGVLSVAKKEVVGGQRTEVTEKKKDDKEVKRNTVVAAAEGDLVNQKAEVFVMEKKEVVRQVEENVVAEEQKVVEEEEKNRVLEAEDKVVVEEDVVAQKEAEAMVVKENKVLEVEEKAVVQEDVVAEKEITVVVEKNKVLEAEEKVVFDDDVVVEKEAEVVPAKEEKLGVKEEIVKEENKGVEQAPEVVVVVEDMALKSKKNKKKKKKKKKKTQKQKEEKELSDLKTGDDGLSLMVTYLIVSIGIIHYYTSWPVLFGVPAIVVVLASIIFTGLFFPHKFVRPKGSSFSRMARVFLAAALKMNLPRPSNPGCTKDLRWLEKAALSSRTEERRRKKWRLCTYEEVEEAKSTLRMVPIWLTFIICGVVLATGTTYFLAQGVHMKNQIGFKNFPFKKFPLGIFYRRKVPLPVFLLVFQTSKVIAHRSYEGVKDDKSKPRKHLPTKAIGIGMFMSVMCCVIAGSVEVWRIHEIKKHNLVNMPNKTIPLNVLWLLPQFCFLGLFKGVLSAGIEDLYKRLAPSSMQDYMDSCTSAIIGVGTLFSVLVVYVAGKATERGGKPSWFGDTANNSRLDNYYWSLAILSTVNLAFYALISKSYYYKLLTELKEQKLVSVRDHISNAADDEESIIDKDELLQPATDDTSNVSKKEVPNTGERDDKQSVSDDEGSEVSVGSIVEDIFDLF